MFLFCFLFLFFVFFRFFLLFIFFFFFFFNDTATTEIYTLSLHDALPISRQPEILQEAKKGYIDDALGGRSEEHTSELQSRFDLVCRLLLEKKKKKQYSHLYKTKKKKKIIKIKQEKKK